MHIQLQYEAHVAQNAHNPKILVRSFLKLGGYLKPNVTKVLFDNQQALVKPDTTERVY